MFIAILFILLGFALLIKGADILVDGASSIAKKFGIPEIIIGLTIVSIGTSMPELFVSAASALHNSSDMSIGNIIGSNLCNLLLILGLSTVIKPVVFQKQTKKIDIPICLLVTIAFLIMCNTGNTITRIEGILLLLCCTAFIAYTIFIARKSIKEQKENEKSNEEKKNISVLKSIIFVVLGIVGLKIGGDLTVDNALKIANMFNVSEKIIGLTILAIGTSLPELVTSVTAAIKGNSDIAIGNIIGSNLFNILLIMGVSSAISNLTYNPTYNIQMGILLVATAMLFVFPYIKPKDKMGKIEGSIYLLMYLGFMIYSIIA